jgi:predicted membrane protein
MTTEPRQGFRMGPQVILGLLIVVFGLLLTADNLGFADTSHLRAFWPLTIVAFGLAKFLQSSQTSGRVVGGLIILAGLWLTANTAFGFSIDMSEGWPVILIILGIALVLRGRRGPNEDQVTSADSRVTEFALMSGIQRKNASPGFKRADLTAVMGGVEFDLRQAATADGEAVIDVFAMWGGVEIFVPPDWAVSNDVVAIMGGAEDKSTGNQTARHRLKVRGFVIMGGVEIKT